MNELAVEAVDAAARRAAQFGRAARDRVQNRLHLGRRATYRRQDLAGRRLMFQRLRQVSRLRLHLVEQARVLAARFRQFRVALGQGLDQILALWSSVPFCGGRRLARQ